MQKAAATQCLALLVLSARVVLALGPVDTSYALAVANPLITAAPELARRQASVETCGFVNGQSSKRYNSYISPAEAVYKGDTDDITQMLP